MSKKLQSPNDSLLQSTRDPSTRSGDRTSLDVSMSFGSTRKFLTGGSQIGGGSYKSYIIDHLKQMHANIEDTTRKLELEQRRLYRLDKDLVIAESEYNQKRQNSQKRQKYKKSQNTEDDSVQHRIAEVKLLERKLEKAITDLNKETSENNQLRDNINQLRKERLILNNVFKQLQNNIEKGKTVVNKLMVSINDEKSTREEASQRTKALHKMLERERRTFHKDTERLKNELHKEGDVQKEQEKLARSTERSSDMKQKGRRAYMVADEEEAFSEQSMHRRILKLSFLNTIQRRHIKQHQKNIEVFEQAFATIKSSTGISDIEEIVKIFIHLEQRNFSLLTYVNQLNREIETIEIHNRELQNQLANHQLEESDSCRRKESALSEINTQITKTKAATVDKDKMIEGAAAALNECRPLIWKIVRFLKREIPPLVNVAYEGEPQPMKTAPPDEHEEQLNHHLMYIEEALLQFRTCLAPEALLKRALPQPKASSSMSGTKKPSELPTAHFAGDDSDDDPETGLGDKVWTRGELRDLVNRTQRRRKKPGQPGKAPHGGGGAQDPGDDSVGEVPPARRDVGPPPPKEHVASSVTSKDSAGDSGPSGVSATLSKSPSMSGKQNSEATFKSSPPVTDVSLREGVIQHEEDKGGPRGAVGSARPRAETDPAFRDEMWWRSGGQANKPKK